MMSFKLSLRNIQNSFKNYTIYFITLIVGVAIFYTFNSMDSQAAMSTLSASKTNLIKSMVQLLSVISVVVSIILGYLIVYANNFLIRRRKKEFGIYQSLGMSKRRIGKILLVETLIIGILSLIVGIFIGIFISQGMSVLIIHLFEANMSDYRFAFSGSAVIKTCVYFGIIYGLVMIFNVFTVNRYKLIDLLMASRKNEVLKVKKTWISVLMFIASMICIGAAYYMLRVRHALTKDLTEAIIMLILGTIGTYLLFSSLAGFLLKMVQMRKNTYYRGLNMFVLRQINSRVNTMKISMTIISIMLLLTIGIMSSALSLVNAFNNNLEETNRSDMTLFGYRDKDVSVLEGLKKQGYDYTKELSGTAEYTTYMYQDNNLDSKEYLGKEAVEQIQNDFQGMIRMDDSPLYLMRESEYNKLMELYGEKKIDLKGEQYALIANFEQLIGYYDKQLAVNKTITVAGKKLSSYSKSCIDMALENSNMKSETGTFIVPDVVIENAKAANGKDGVQMMIRDHRVCANYLPGDLEKMDEATTAKIKKLMKQDNAAAEVIITKVEMENSSIGTTAIFTFIGLYLGIIFSITSAAILAIGQLSESADNKERYAVLRKIGVDDKMINQSLLLQIGIYFILPLSVAIIHSIVGIREVSHLISLFGHLQLDKNILLTALFITIIYGAYFIATYLGSKGIIKEKEKYVG